jgi:hypothetical protein
MYRARRQDDAQPAGRADQRDRGGMQYLPGFAGKPCKRDLAGHSGHSISGTFDQLDEYLSKA